MTEQHIKYYYVLKNEDEDIAARDATVDKEEVARIKADAEQHLKASRLKAIQIIAQAKQDKRERDEAAMRAKEQAWATNKFKKTSYTRIWNSWT